MSETAVEQFAWKCDSEGLDYALENYCGAETLKDIEAEDAELAADIRQVQPLLGRISEKLEPFMP